MATVLRDDQLARIDELVRQGAYPSSDAALDDALALAERKVKLRGMVQEGIDDLNQGRIVDLKTAFADARRVIGEIASERETGAATP